MWASLAILVQKDVIANAKLCRHNRATRILKVQPWCISGVQGKLLKGYLYGCLTEVFSIKPNNYYSWKGQSNQIITLIILTIFTKRMLVIFTPPIVTSDFLMSLTVLSNMIFKLCSVTSTTAKVTNARNNIKKNDESTNQNNFFKFCILITYQQHLEASQTSWWSKKPNCKIHITNCVYNMTVLWIVCIRLCFTLSISHESNVYFELL